MDRLKKRKVITFDIDEDVDMKLKKLNIKGKGINFILRLGLERLERDKKLDYIIQKLNEINLNLKESNIAKQELLELNEFLKIMEDK